VRWRRQQREGVHAENSVKRHPQFIFHSWRLLSLEQEAPPSCGAFPLAAGRFLPFLSSFPPIKPIGDV
jgi:hypothetical protein